MDPLIVLINEAPSLDRLREQRPPEQFGYEPVVRDPARHAVAVDLETGKAG
ncbi:hypothetical protein [Enterovirga aerilata]|uniref:Uncharacterized protein n=1 Tax=Enterovirga aerilata TaxID=2730920 RepID=A0A849IJM8_9HYPH|nr:hypothetical protein [Enterovirga sp. DB1703]NNM74143.1 hypothetical protein [Enterovirga sp. DB1703]